MPAIDSYGSLTAILKFLGSSGGQLEKGKVVFRQLHLRRQEDVTANRKAVGQLHRCPIADAVSASHDEMHAQELHLCESGALHLQHVPPQLFRTYPWVGW